VRWVLLRRGEEGNFFCGGRDKIRLDRVLA
jgi:hypothetical protein